MTKTGVGNRRTCLHCVLERAVRAERRRCGARPVTIILRDAGPVWLPMGAVEAYRHARALLL